MPVVCFSERLETAQASQEGIKCTKAKELLLQRICYSHWANGGLKWDDLHWANGVSLIMTKAPSDSPIWQLKKRELLLKIIRPML